MTLLTRCRVETIAKYIAVAVYFNPLRLFTAQILYQLCYSFVLVCLLKLRIDFFTQKHTQNK